VNSPRQGSRAGPGAGGPGGAGAEGGQGPWQPETLKSIQTPLSISVWIITNEIYEAASE
jgi:hypothetical protein